MTKSSSSDPYSAEERNHFVFGWTPQAEIWNGRFAMLGFAVCLLWYLLIRFNSL